jgi:hypothetical protein
MLARSFQLEPHQTQSFFNQGPSSAKLLVDSRHSKEVPGKHIGEDEGSTNTRGITLTCNKKQLLSSVTACKAKK